jgi:hypothetical protein
MARKIKDHHSMTLKTVPHLVKIQSMENTVLNVSGVFLECKYCTNQGIPVLVELADHEGI